MKKEFGILAVILTIFFAGIFVYKKQHTPTKSNSLNGSQQNEIRVLLNSDFEDIAFIYNFTNDNGFFSKNNLSTEKIEAGKNYSAILAAGQADIYIGSSSGSIKSYFSETPLNVVANLFKPFDYYGISRYPKEQFSSIKNVVVQSLTSDPALTMRHALKNIGVDPDSVQMMANITSDGRAKMLTDGQADFAVIDSAKYVFDNQLDKKFTIVPTNSITEGSASVRTLNVMQTYVAQSPQVIQKYVSATYQALQYIKGNPNETKKYIAAKYGFNEEQTSTFYNSLVDSINQTSFVPNVQEYQDFVPEVQKFYQINSQKDIAGLIYGEFAKKAMAK